MSTDNDSTPQDWPEAQRLAVALIEGGDHGGAIDTLNALADKDGGGEAQALLALAYFHSEQYALAAKRYEAALLTEPGNDEWRDMLTRSRANEAA